MSRYPCKECIIKTICSRVCEKLTDGDKHDFLIENRHCPDCGCERLIGCGGDAINGNESLTLIESCVSCIECGSLYFRDVLDPHRIIRYRKHRKLDEFFDNSKIITFWDYLRKYGFITEKEYYNGK
jgi:hypothetical protein